MITRLRDFERRDFEALWQIDQICFLPGIAYSRRELWIFIRLWKAFTLVAESVETEVPQSNSSPRIAGFLVADARRITGHIITIDVLPDFRRTGVGSQLLEEAEKRLLAANCRGVSLETAVENTSAIAFYKRHGYRVLRTSPQYYSNGSDALVFFKDLLSRAQAS